MRFSSKLSLIAWSLIWPLLNVRGIDDSCAPAHKTDKYDYIVVGSGPGGGPLAARLAIAGYSVLLLEAGGDHSTDLTVEIPLLQTQSSEYIPQSWQFFVSHYSNNTQALLDSKFTWRQPNGTFWVGPNPPAGSTPLGIYYPRAAALGGCAEHNALALMYPHDSDWNFIANLTGDHSWKSSNMRKYWERMENNQYIPEGTPAASGHGYGGWLNVSVPDINLVPEDPKWISLTEGAASTLGKGFLPSPDPVTGETLEKVLTLDVNNDLPNHDLATGIYQLPLSVSLGDRSRSSPRDFLVHTSKARNPDGSKKYKLDIQLNTLVTRILFDKSSPPRATGVEYTTGCGLYSASPNSASATITGKGNYTASREIIVAGGTYNTPQLLKLSGIGTRKELEPLKIPVVLESPGVGTNMQDRYEVSVVGMAPDNFAILHNCTFLHNPVLDNNLPEPEEDPCLFQWQNDAQNRGIYGTNGVAFGVVHQTTVSEPTEADMFIVGYPANFHGYFPGYSMAADLEHWSWLVLKAHSRNNAGTVTLKSANPFDMPQIDFHSFARGGDLDTEAVFEGIQLVRKFFAQSPDLNGTFTEVIPGPQIKTEPEIKQWLRDEAWGHHASCSVPIGASNDPNAPLDSKFRVKGVEGLRVVDASAFPRIPGFYVAGAIYMISEKAADVIIEAAEASSRPHTGVVHLLKTMSLSVWDAPPSTLFAYAVVSFSAYYFISYRLRK